MKASEKLCAKSFLKGLFEVYWGCIVWYFVGGDVRGYSADCFPKVEDDVVHYNGADQKKKSFVCRMFFLSPSF